MEQISQRVMNLSPSATLAMSQKSNELKAQGVHVINLSVGEPDFFTPDHIKEAAKKAIDDNFSFYTPVPGYLSLRKAIAAKLKNENGVDFAPEQIIVSNGAKQSLCNCILSAINPGDEVIIHEPSFVCYKPCAVLAGGVPVTIETKAENHFKLTKEELLENAKAEIKKLAPSIADHMVFEKAVFNAFGLTAIYDNVKTSLLSMQETRAKKKEK